MLFEFQGRGMFQTIISNDKTCIFVILSSNHYFAFFISDIESQTYNSALVGAAMEKKVTMICIIIGITIAILFVLIR